MKKRLPNLVAVFVLCFSCYSIAGTRLVPASYPTIQDAIDAAVNGDTVIVSPGTYVENINMLGKAITLSSTIPTNIWTVMNTIIDGTSTGSIITCISGEDPNTVITGFLITNGFAERGAGMRNNNSSPTVTNCTFSGNSAMIGGGIYNENNSSPTLTNCTFSDNMVYEGGGGIFNDSSSPMLTNCTFSGNMGVNDGGGVYNYSSSPTLNNCTFSGNASDNYGGGMCNRNTSSPIVNNCTFSGNTANYGGGMVNSSSSSTVSNCTFIGNSATDDGGGMRNVGSPSPEVSNCTFIANTTAEDGGGMCNKTSSPIVTNCTFSGNTATDYGGGVYNQSSSPAVTNCIIWGNIADILGDEVYNDSIDSDPNFMYCDIAGSGGSTAWDPSFGTDGGNNIDTDPLFADEAGGNLHLKSEFGRVGDPTEPFITFDDVTSPGIDAGNPNDDYSSEPIANGGRINIGAYGGSREASISGFTGNIEGDVDGDGDVDVNDLQIIAHQLGKGKGKD